MDKIKVHKIVNEIKERYAIIGPSVNPIDIANELSINVYEVDNLNANGEKVSGAISHNDGDIDIYVNAQDTNERKKFTIAHELGHYFLDHLNKNPKMVDLLFRDDNHNLAKEEKEADEFAGCILMDEKEIRNRYKKATSIGMTEDTKISILANIFNVSKPAMYTRLKNLELIKS
ncbi:ImmA/IrrE family metallo-endopeptidase (plasmid) [Clostridium botulinum]|uniref:IrrE N-terminal-like domain-containing protein n=1 Tax=Clostridium botulinum C/D str. DC5 TaxID=1443128 RepID=A0A0A0HY56_CLOBO|nr:ImmA/IrrE family metallo-endopeptidase [Clostridium botulinum]KGM93328.1 hypothetical protein Z955_15230 [Clostridium botulinum C/D str. DC5]KOC56172.1 hypothetical protein ADU89_03795 [Clostridium botulinum]KOC56583.1 hypothetical protein ADU90_07760 [Clostridium botulinum]MCD3234810.1 ImmA/IrrE family metallo-endopeptidase [Clostridium botulinum D/C]MCD3240955.1 ImmA/IrrE family metallo-endopeptidase [Clostridium botulinum D/C]